MGFWPPFFFCKVVPCRTLAELVQRTPITLLYGRYTYIILCMYIYISYTYTILVVIHQLTSLGGTGPMGLDPSPQTGADGKPGPVNSSVNQGPNPLEAPKIIEHLGTSTFAYSNAKNRLQAINQRTIFSVSEMARANRDF